MSVLKVTSLASGSSGNALLVEAGNVCFLVDAGIPTTAIERELAAVGVSPGNLVAILLTHEHTDHIQSAGVLSRRYQIPVVASPGTFMDGGVALGMLRGGTTIMQVGATLSLGDVTVTSFAVPHDACEPVGYFIEHDGWRVCYATDLGHVPPAIYDYFEAADLVILEANHDVPTLRHNSSYPDYLKGRILSDRGHLSNDQTGGIAATVLGKRPQCLWLAHLSAENNTPDKAVKQVSRYIHMAGKHQLIKLEVARRNRRSVSWCAAEALMQGTLF